MASSLVKIDSKELEKEISQVLDIRRRVTTLLAGQRICDG